LLDVPERPHDEDQRIRVVGKMATVMRVGLTANAGMAHKTNANNDAARFIVFFPINCRCS